MKIAAIICCIIAPAFGLSPAPEGFPATWNGDRYFKSECEIIQKPPSWVDGYLFAQLSASYGERSAPDGQRVDHMFDSIGALALFDIGPEKSTFTGAYYPTTAYRIWNFYDRDFSKSFVSWRAAYADKNETMTKLWDQIIPPTRVPSIAPNVDFWKIGNDIVAGTEHAAYGLWTFDIDTADNFHLYPFKEADSRLQGQPFIPMHMPIHERVDPDTGLIWATTIALDLSKGLPTLHQILFSVDQQGNRKIEGVFDFSSWNPSKCSSQGRYGKSETDMLPRLMHSITSTEKYIIIPFTSVAFNPCVLLRGPNAEFKFADFYHWDPESKVSILLFDKKKKEFLPLINYDGIPLFIAHQFNAYEVSDTVLIADMTAHDNYAYDALTIKNAQNGDLRGLSLRFTIDLEKKTATSKSILPDSSTPIEFPQFNHNFEGKRYKYGYVVEGVYLKDNAIVKIDVDDPTGKNNKRFKPKIDSVSLLEPYFVQKPGTTGEDDGVVVTRGLDVEIGKARVYILDAKTMEQVGEIVAPTDTPFGFHERFYLKSEFEIRKSKKKAKVEL